MTNSGNISKSSASLQTPCCCGGSRCGSRRVFERRLHLPLFRSRCRRVVAGVLAAILGTSLFAGVLPDEGASSPDASAGPKFLEKPAIIFSLDQNWGNSIIEQRDAVGLGRVIDALKRFQQKYEVYALVSADQGDTTKLDWALGMLAANKIPFVFDAYTSDAMAHGLNAIDKPYDGSHGMAISVDRLQQYKNQYPSLFAGIRGFEVFGLNLSVIGTRFFGADWCKKWFAPLPSDGFFQKKILEAYARFAHENHMFFYFADHSWSGDLTDWNFAPPMAKAFAGAQAEGGRSLKEVLTEYPDTVVVGYENNASGLARMDSWENLVAPYVQYGAKGFGLTDQSWMCADENQCPASLLAAWAKKAFARGALIVQTEPDWYWWNFPRGIIGLRPEVYYTKKPEWENRGYANSTLEQFGEALGVSLSGLTIIPKKTLSLSPAGSTLTPGESGSLATPAGTWTFGAARISNGNTAVLLNDKPAPVGFSSRLVVGQYSILYSKSMDGAWLSWNGYAWKATTRPVY